MGDLNSPLLSEEAASPTSATEAKDESSIGSGSGPKHQQDDEPILLSKEELNHEVDRVLAFTDAVVAIAMTLLILPLMEAAAELGGEHSEVDVREYFSANSHKLWPCAISFWVMSSAWRGHDILCQRVGRFTWVLMLLNFAWMAGMVFLPVATTLKMQSANDDVMGDVVYFGTVMYGGFISMVMGIIIRNDKRTWKGERRPGRFYVVVNGMLVLLMALAILISSLVPGAGSYAILLLLAAPFLAHLVKWIPGFSY